MQDSIERSINVKATKERVYQAITDPRQIVAWFPQAIEGSLDVGERPVFDFGDHGKGSTYIVAARPHDYFAYRWIPGGPTIVDDVLAVPNALVEFFIKEAHEGTEITVKESGFAALPSELAERSIKENAGGWEHMIGRLKELVEKN